MRSPEAMGKPVTPGSVVGAAWDAHQEYSIRDLEFAITEAEAGISSWDSSSAGNLREQL